MGNLADVIALLQSKKVGERQEGLSALRNTFSNPRVVANFHIKKDGTTDDRAWLAVFKGIFNSISIEVNGYGKANTSSAALLRRLADLTACFRWLTEISLTSFSKDTLDVLISHIVKRIAHNGELFRPVAADYVKILRCLLQYQPHADHINRKQWVALTGLAFNVVLDDPVDESLDEPYSNDEVEPEEDPDNDSMLEDDDPDDSEASPSPTKKRKRARSAVPSKKRTPGPSSRIHRDTSRQPQPQITTEQIECMGLLSFLLALPKAPIVSRKHPHLSVGILQRLQRFLDIYPTDTSLHGDYLSSLSSVLSHLALNSKSDVEHFAQRTWTPLANLWGTKNKALKEGLVAVLTVLLPYYTTGEEATWADGLRKLWYLLRGEGHSRWGVDVLALDTLRLTIPNTVASAAQIDPFVAQTFRSGNGFDASQALAWASLELQSDILAKLHWFSESVGIRAPAKRGKLDNPLSSVLSAIQREPTSPLRSYRLQLLLFFVDRHWTILHSSFQLDVFNTLLQFISFDDPEVQSWVYLCLAAVAYADGFMPNTINDDVQSDNHQIQWDPVWTHAMRRATVPLVCRPACHIAHILLYHSITSPSTSTTDAPSIRQPLASHRILAEIEVLLKDLDVQGPSAPFDAVCKFLAESLKIASQDARLYRMQLEEKVLNWLTDCWKPIPVSGSAPRTRHSAENTRFPINTLSDILLLLESVSGLAKGSNLTCRMPPPICWITNVLMDQAKSTVIREFLLHAKLPPFVHPRQPAGPASHREFAGGGVESFDAELVQPTSRERKLSAFFLKVLDGVVGEWDLLVEENGYASAETARSSVDFAVAALCYESVLNYNGFRPNRRTVQLSCKVCKVVSSWLSGTKWPPDEKAFIIRGLEALWDPNVPDVDCGQAWISMLQPDEGSGIHSQILRELTMKEAEGQSLCAVDQYRKIMWASADVQDAFGAISTTFQELLRTVIEAFSASRGSSDREDKDGFGPTRKDVAAQGFDNYRTTDFHSSPRLIIRACVTFLTFVPVLQSSSGEATRDKHLTELVLDCAASRPEEFLLIFPAFLSQIRSKSLVLHTSSFSVLLDCIPRLFDNYHVRRNPMLSLLTIQLLDATLHIWLAPSFADNALSTKVRDLCEWLMEAIAAGSYPTWRIRDSAACFLERCLALDPKLTVWSQLRRERSPLTLLPTMGEDDDIRVRFRAASVNARLFGIASLLRQSATALYDSIRSVLTTNLSFYEPILTRLLCLGNIMISSSAVRRGAYWHLIEICLHSTDYNPHIETILRQVAQRMGLANLSTIFETYASQLAYSICEGKYDVLRFPPHLLGYADRRQSAEAAFRAFTPTNLLGDSSHGIKLFRGHCKVMQKSPQDGIRECFGDIVGMLIVAWFGGGPNRPSDQLDELLRSTCQMTHDETGFEALLKQNVDSIVTAVLHTLGDQDFAQDGSIHKDIQAVLGQRTAQDFAQLSRYRKSDDFATHTPNLPAYTTSVVLHALLWCDSQLPGCKDPAITFHVLHTILWDIHRSPLVNEQIRLANALSVWVTLRAAHFKEFTILHSLTQGAAALMAQHDMARVSQSLLHWCFDQYRSHLLEDPCLSDILVRLCCQAHDFARASGSSSNLGHDLLTWIDGQATLFSRSPIHRKQVLHALPTWSHQLAPDLATLFEDVQADTLSDIIADRAISSNKFRLVRRLRELADEGDSDTTRFSNSDFWRLKDSIPSAEELQAEDVSAFTGLLIHHNGRIDGVGMSRPDPFSIRTKHRLAARNTPSGWSSQNAILFGLLTMLDSGHPSEVHRAFTTLRQLISSSPDTITHATVWTPPQLCALTYFQTCMPVPRASSVRPLSALTDSSYMESFGSFPRWINGITTLLSDILASHDPFYAQLTPILRSDVTFAEQLLPVLVLSVLQLTTDSATRDENRLRLTDYFTAVLRASDASPRCLSSVVDVILHLRYFNPPGKDALAHDKWLGVDYALLARSSVKCGAYTTAILFLELAAEHNPSDSLSDSEETLYEIYSHIDEPDGFYGIRTSDHRQFLLRRFHHEGQWDKAFRFHGAALEARSHDQATMDGLIQSYHSFGFNQLAINTLQSTLTGPSTAAVSYRLGWRTETWDLPDQTNNQDGISVYAALRAAHRDRDPMSIQATVRQSMFHEMNRLRGLGIENHAEIRDVIRNLMCLDQVGQWTRLEVQQQLASKQVSHSLRRQFTKVEPDFEFLDLESLMSTRVSLIRSARLKAERTQIGTSRTPFLDELFDLERTCLLRLSEAARQAHDGQVALNAITRAQRLHPIAEFEISREFAHVLWAQKEEKAAVQLLRELLGDTEAQKPRQRAALLARLGSWTSEACLEKPTAILDQYFSPAVSLVKNMDLRSVEPAHADVYHQCAMFAEGQYRVILKSPDGERWKLYAENKEAEIKTRKLALDNLKSGKTSEKELSGLQQDINKAKRIHEADMKLFEEHHKAKEAFLAQAIEMYSSCLASSQDYDDDGALRLSTLWFANFDAEGLHDTIEKAVGRVPSYKFVFLAHQLAARLWQPSRDAPLPSHQTILQELILRMCKEHPYHSLYQVLCLSPRDYASSLTSRRSSGRLSQQEDASGSSSTPSEREEAALAVLNILQNDPSQTDRVRRIKQVFYASLDWAMYEVDKSLKKRTSSKPFPIPSHFQITKLSNPGVPVLTAPLPLDPTMKYENCTMVTRFDKVFTLAGGVNLPKITDCYGSDGERYKQLFKGNDDLRQDAVMEQVFELVNVVLRRDRQTQRRCLRVRGYKVVPLGPQAGVLEFVVNTMPLATWLNSAHPRYRPNDLLPHKVSQTLGEAQRGPGNNNRPHDMIPALVNARKQFKPVMRHWFTEQYKLPTSWFSARLHYTRSVATTSIVGHILGLGDRHVSNILLETATGEVVHIDLGIAFEQGKLLPIPERVPFRMTPDMVDGMGTSGTQGVFQRCAEETLRVLRDGSQIILTVLEVFKYDPLHQWTVSERKFQQVQQHLPSTHENASTSEPVEQPKPTSAPDPAASDKNASKLTQELADRVLSSVASKLDKSLSVEYTVNQLIADSTDINNLACMFSGWSPHL